MFDNLIAAKPKIRGANKIMEVQRYLFIYY